MLKLSVMGVYTLNMDMFCYDLLAEHFMGLQVHTIMLLQIM